METQHIKLLTLLIILLYGHTHGQACTILADSADRDSSNIAEHASHTIASDSTRTDSTIVRLLREDGITFSHDNNITLLKTGQEKFDDMFCAIKQARHSVHLEYFNFRNDSIAMLLFNILIEKAKEGIEVRALYDAFGNSSNNKPLKKKHITWLRGNGVQIHEFDPIRFPWANHIFGRDHRKIVVIDGQIAYTGGMNVADYYIEGTEQVGKWCDMHCRLEGTEVNTLQKIFLKAWEKVTGESIDGKQYYNGDSPKHTYKGLKDYALPTAHKMMCGIVNREPHKTPKAVRQFYYHTINAAKDTMRIINPYFTLIPKIKKAIKRAVKRGVVVQIMISEPSDIPLTPDCVFYNANKMQKAGCQVWVYQPGFHHTKVIMVDGEVCTVGSTNLDARSLKCDYEANVAIIDPHVTQQLTDLFENDKKFSFKLEDGVYKKWRTPWQRFRAWFAHLFSPFM